MYLRKNTAENIIKEISKVLDYDINIMDGTGKIIASTNSQRVSEFHEGAYKIINENLAQLIVVRDGEYVGCKKGVNFPIFFKKQLLGVIGITGDPEETLKYGKIIKKMTEVLVLDLFDHHQRNLNEQSKMIFFHEWLNGIRNDEDQGFEDTIKSHGLSPKGPFVVAVIKPRLSSVPNDEEGVAFIVLSDSIIVIGNMDSPQQMRDILERKLTPHIQEENVLCAIGSRQPRHIDVNRSYKHALKTLNRNIGEKTGTILYDEEILEIILDDVPLNQRTQYVEKIFSGVSMDNKKDYIDFVQIYCKHDGSINKIADELFIHKNTVQYKINKIKDATGKDLRKSLNLVELYLASRWI